MLPARVPGVIHNCLLGRLYSLVLISTVITSGNAEIDNSSIKMTNLPKIMRAVGLYKYLPISDVDSLIDVEVSLPTLRRTDVLVELKVAAINPIDTKQRAPKPTVETTPRILGWDGAGIVVDRGVDSKSFNIGDEVFFTGDPRRNGANAQYVALDEVLVGPKPRNLTFEQAAAMPLTAVTAYEALYDRLQITEKDKGKTLLIINSAGGVGSVASQMAKNSGLTVIGTASRLESKTYSLEHGAHTVLNHSMDLVSQLNSTEFSDGVDFILANYDPYPYWNVMMQLIKPQGKICLLVDSSGLVDLKPLKDKCITLVSEMMFTRIKYNTSDKYRHQEILKEISKMLESGDLKTTLAKVLSPINAANLKEAHRIMEEQNMVGKLVLSGF